MSIFNEEQIKAMFSREYICHECGHLMEFEDVWGIRWCVPAAATVSIWMITAVGAMKDMGTYTLPGK